MTKEVAKVFAAVLNSALEADKFHLVVAKALLSEPPPDERVKAYLRDQLARREGHHERLEALIEQMKQILQNPD